MVEASSGADRRVNRFDEITDDLDEIDRLTEQMFGAAVRVSRSDGRAPSLRLAQAAVPDYGVQRVTWNVDGQCEVEPLGVFLSIRLRRGTYGLDQGHGCVEYAAGDTFIADPGRPVSAKVFGADLDSFTISTAALQAVAAQIAPGSRGVLDFQQTRPVTRELATAWDEVLDDVGRTLRRDDPAADSQLVQAGLLYRLSATACAAFALVAEPSAERPVTSRAVRRAVAYIEEHLAEPISTGDIAEAAGVSVRGMQAAFQRTLETSPHAYLQRARLTAVRRDLVDADAATSVAGVALRWGFTHLGRFASAYRDEFGELPSATLRA